MIQSQMCYRKLRKWKYQLHGDYAVRINFKPQQAIAQPFISLSGDGLITLKNRYAWDGPSGPTIDTRNFMRASLIHDALYQLMREKILDHERDRKHADLIMKSMCREDGMSRLRAAYVYLAVRLFGGAHARPEETGPADYICVP